jgi:hypothetical protein
MCVGLCRLLARYRRAVSRSASAVGCLHRGKRLFDFGRLYFGRGLIYQIKGLFGTALSGQPDFSTAKVTRYQPKD